LFLASYLAYLEGHSLPLVYIYFVVECAHEQSMGTATPNSPNGNAPKEEHSSSAEVVDVPNETKAPRAQYSQDMRYSLKFLVPDTLAGLLIGRGGTTIHEIHSTSGAKVDISPMNKFYPGTLERIVCLTGSKDALSKAQAAIWAKVAQFWQPKPGDLHGSSPDENTDNMVFTCKLLIPQSASGAIIGKGGEHIRSISESSGAQLRLSTRDEDFQTHERILTISGSTQSCIAGSEFVLDVLHDDARVHPYVYPGYAYESIMSMGGFTPRVSGDRDTNGVATVSATTTITLAVPERLIGTVLGPKGSTIMEISRFTGARITISRRDEFVEGTTNRLVAIVGTIEAAQSAHAYIARKLKQEETRKLAAAALNSASSSDGTNAASSS
jgi:RNA-binding protein Nova